VAVAKGIPGLERVAKVAADIPVVVDTSRVEDDEAAGDEGLTV
jgi:hypothetical protein